MRINHDSLTSKSSRTLGLLLGSALLSIALAGCTSVSETAPEEAGSSGDTTQEAQDASVALTDLVRPATQIGVAEELAEQPEPGETIVMIQCEVPDCQVFTQGAQRAAEHVGWNLKTITFNTAEPSTLVSAMEQALQFDPVAVSFVGVPHSVWATQIPKFEAAGAAIIPISVGDVELGSAVPVNLSDSDNFKLEGGMMANWVIAESNASASVLVVDYPAYDVVHAKASGFIDTLGDKCAECRVTTLDISLTQLSTNAVVPAIISAVRRDPEIDYIFSTESQLAQGLRLELDSAGLSNVRIVAGSPVAQDFQTLTQGANDAYSFQPKQYIGWQLVDSALRFSQGMETQEDGGGWPLMLLTKDNIGEFDVEAGDQPKGYANQFTKLWNVE